MPGYDDGGPDQPVALPADPNGYPDPAGNSPSGRYRLLHTRLSPVPSSVPPKGRARLPAGSRPRFITAANGGGRQLRLPRAAPHATGHGHDGGHQAHRTAAHPRTQTGVVHQPAGAPRTSAHTQLVFSLLGAVSGSTAGGMGFGFGRGQSVPLGHHPHATGLPRHYSTQYQGAARRAEIISYDSATNTALVRYADTPDSQGVRISVSPLITPALIGSATLGGVSLWDAHDPTDSLLTAVF